MKLREFAEEIADLMDAGHGDLEMYAVHGASGAADEIGNPRVTDEVDEEMGPFDLEPGQRYISVYIGN